MSNFRVFEVVESGGICEGDMSNGCWCLGHLILPIKNQKQENYSNKQKVENRRNKREGVDLTLKDNIGDWLNLIAYEK